MTQKQIDLNASNNDSSYNNVSATSVYNSQDDGLSDILNTAIQSLDSECIETSPNEYYKRMQLELSAELNDTIRSTLNSLLSTSDIKKKVQRAKPYSKSSSSTPSHNQCKKIQVKNYIFYTQKSNLNGKMYIMINENSNSLINNTISLLTEDIPQIIGTLQTLLKTC